MESYGSGRSKKEAKQMAARALTTRLNGGDLDGGDNQET